MITFRSRNPIAIRRLRVAALVSTLLVGMGALSGAAWGQDQSAGSWEMRVCADPDGLPFSSRELDGFDNRVAQILADELDARLTFDWFTQGPDMVEYRLRMGLCDMIVGVPDGYQDLLSTIAYYQSPYVFMYPADAAHDVTSLDDPALRDMRIGVQATGIPPHDALVERGLSENVVRSYGGPSIHNAWQTVGELARDLEGGVIDIGFAWGPAAGYVAERSAIELELVPVSPAFEPPFLSQIFAMTIAVRPGDESLRDRLNIALAARWEEIQAVLEDYGVPTSPMPPPPPQQDVADVLRIGVVVPGTTGHTVLRGSTNDLTGDAARLGALLAESTIANAGTSRRTLKVLPASSPTVEATRRAAARLVAVEGVDAIVGGLGDGQAAALARVAEEAGILFFNIGSTADELRQACLRNTFHIEASAGMYLDALVDWYAGLGHDRWFVVHEGTEEGEALLEEAVRAVREGDAGQVVGTAAVSSGQPVYSAELRQAAEEQADVILVLLNELDQVAFLGQKETFGPEAAVALFPHAPTQTRDFIAATSYAADHGANHRVLLWETTLEEGEMGELNSRYTTRNGRPMDPTAWAAYQAVQIIARADSEAPGGETEDLVAVLESPATTFPAKGSELSFRPEDHQLLQPLYVATVQPDATWGRTLSQMVSFAELAATVPTDGDFRRLGSSGSTCE